MTPLPKRKHTPGRTGRRRNNVRLTKKDLYAAYSKGKGLEKRVLK